MSFKATRRVTDQKTNLPVLYIKLSSSLGFTWLLGFIYPFAKVEFLAYLFVICNSLQGQFVNRSKHTSVGGTLRNVWVAKCRWDPGTPEPLACTRLSWAEFLLVYILDRTPKIYARFVVAIFLKLLFKFDDLPILSFLVAILVSQVETKIFNQLVSFRDNGSI